MDITTTRIEHTMASPRTNRLFSANQTGFMSDFIENSFYNSSTFSGELLRQSDQKNEDIKREKERRMNHLKQFFQKRFNEDTEIFQDVDKRKIYFITNTMAELMLAFSPTSISPDVTYDKSVVLQARYGILHFYWEAFFESDADDVHSTLNVFSEKTLVYSTSGNFRIIAQNFLTLLPQ
jgi:hypothetical protein